MPDYAPMSAPGPMFNQGAADRSKQRLAMALMQGNQRQGAATPLGGLDTVARMGLQGLMMRDMARDKPEPGMPNAPEMTKGAPPSFDGSGNADLMPGDAGMSLPGYGGFGDEIGGGSGPVMDAPTLQGAATPDPGMSQYGFGGFGDEYGGLQGFGGPGGIDTANSTGIGAMSGTGAGGNGTITPAPVKIICTELHRQGLMDDATFAADQKFGAWLSKADPDAIRGYHAWAAPVVNVMRKSRAFTRVVGFIADPWARHMAHCIDPTASPDSIVGAIQMSAGLFLCRMIGRFSRSPAVEA